MTIQKLIIKLEDDTEIREMLRERGIQSLQKQAGYVPSKTKSTWDDTSNVIDGLPTDHILAVSYEDSQFIRELIFSEAYSTISAILDKDRI